jgi:hypothetical protein
MPSRSRRQTDLIGLGWFMGDIAPAIAAVDPERKMALLDTVVHIMRYIREHVGQGVTTRYVTGGVTSVDVWALPESGDDEFVFYVRCQPVLSGHRRIHASMRWRSSNDGLLVATRGFLLRSVNDIDKHLDEAFRSYERARATSLQWR